MPQDQFKIVQLPEEITLLMDSFGLGERDAANRSIGKGARDAQK